MINIFKYLALIILLLISLYLLLAFLLQYIIIGERKGNGHDKFIAYIAAGSIHTEFIFPISNSLFDWTQLIPINQVTNKIINPQFISIGWGSKDFFLNMKDLSSLKVLVVLKTIILPSESALHVEYILDLKDTLPARPLYLTSGEYLKLITYIKDYFLLDSKGNVQKINEFSYYNTDKFFKSHHQYTILNTCNIWTLKGLKIINARRPVWSPLKYGIVNAQK
ncbi:MAG: DUF2459 domain-containing protein [Bacteriovorax sp.]|nr:DUF2459 domain-containing protein [Bacteriovorax sp.]